MKRISSSLGAFSVSLNVKDLEISKAFYKKLGFTIFGGNQEQKWLIMKNGETVIGLFEGIINENMLTFNPGWNQDAGDLETFDDVRKIQESLLNQGIELDKYADKSTSGPEHIIFKDPDGNVIMIDQHR